MATVIPIIVMYSGWEVYPKKLAAGVLNIKHRSVNVNEVAPTDIKVLP